MISKKVFLKNFGCQMNIRDSELVTGILIDNGFNVASSPEAADVVLFNSCSVRKHAEDRLFSNIADLAKLKKMRPELAIGLIGCTAQNYKDRVFEKAPLVDFVCGPGNETDLPSIINDVLKNRCPIVAADKVDQKRAELFPSYRESCFKAYVSISEGCSNFCSYCIVPYVRGKERSRKMEDIIREAKNLAERGFKEITLLGQNVNSYSVSSSAKASGKRQRTASKNDFVKLLEGLNGIKGIERIRFMTSHPKDAATGLFRAMAGLDKVCEHLHLPLQSGSDRVLRRMNRGYTAGRYLGLVKNYRKLVRGGSLTTDIIVGFPGETEKDFAKTESLMKEVGFDSAFMFKYSPRPPAKSAKLKDDIPKEIKQKRLLRLIDLQCAVSRSRNEPLRGTVTEVLVDGRNKKEPLCLTGRTRTNKIVIFKADKGLVGKIVNVKIGSVNPHSLIGGIEQ